MEPPIFKIYMNFSCHHLCCFTIVSLFLLDKSMGQEIDVYNTLASKICVKLLKPP
jgi:hypothetical protein